MYLNRQKQRGTCVIVVDRKSDIYAALSRKRSRMEGNMLWNKPKSVRQIGEIPGREKVYVEDYVIRYAKKLAREGKGEERGAVLLGSSFLHEDSKIYLISGIVEIPGFAKRVSPELSQDTWEKIYTEIKENFTDLEIVGWYYTCRGFAVKEASRLLEIHKRNFQHRDKVLYLYEETGQEDGVFLYRAGKFEKQRGYYIYYEKNPEMLRYMEKEAERHVHIVEQEDDRVLRNIRGIIAEKEKEKQQKKQKESRLSYGVGAMVAMIALLIGAAALKNQNTLEQMKEELSSLQQLTTAVRESGQTTVETIGSSLIKATSATETAVNASEGAAAQETSTAETAMPSETPETSGQ